MRAADAVMPRRCAGFALIIVLWALVLISFITAHLLGNGRLELRIAANLVANAATEAAADGATYHAIFNLMSPQPDRRWEPDGAGREFAIGGIPVNVSVDDESARINPNLAPPAMLEALFRVTGSDPETARRLTAAIGVWVGTSISARTPEATVTEYRRAGLDYVPPGEPLETLDELQRVIGMTPAAFAAIRPHLSLYAALEPNPARATPVILAAMAEAGVERSRTAVPAAAQILRITVQAQGPNRARAGRVAIVRIAPLQQSYVVLSWSRGRN
jgi:general secretion pathway protein K